jgi:hypothetical protein
MIRYFSTLALAIAAATALVVPVVKAETVLIYREGQLVMPQDVAAVLGRSIRLLDDAPAAPAKFDSAEILPAARTQLDALAQGIKLLNPKTIVTIEGHTDASGGAAYNLELSRNRARTVRDYLVQQHGIDAARLKIVGYGPTRPIEDSDPYAAINRRVQFRGS